MEFNIENLEIKNSIKCECGHEFKLKDMTELKRINQSGFYSNIVKHYSNSKCPGCRKDTILLLKQKGQTWEILNIATIKNNKTNVEETYSKIEQKNNTIQEFICPVCKKVCKSQLGLNAHMRAHQN